MKNVCLLVFTVMLIGFCSAQTQKKVTVRYKTEENVPEKRHSLDIYRAKGGDRPVVIFVHGGGWLLGDKDNKITNKVKVFSELNYVFVSVNYRLSSFFSKKTQYPEHPNDVADAVLWTFQNIGKYGGDRNKIVLMGHSAGAQMVSLLGTSERFLPERGIQLNKIKGVISLDTEGYDVYGLGMENVNIYRRIFGDVPKIWKDASPLYQVEQGKQYPPFLIAWRGESFRKSMAENFAQKLRNSGTTAETFSAEPYSHFEVNNKFGAPDDEIVTPRVLGFLKEIFAER